jgi:tellurium resistance protein TerD
MTDDIDDDLNLHPSMVIENPNLVRISNGQDIQLTKIDPTLREITIGIGWDVRAYEGNPVDVDASLFLLDRNDRTREDEDFIFYNNLSGRAGAVKHMGDSRTGAGDGDDENIEIDLMALPFEVVKIAFVLSIYDIEEERNFNDVKNVYFRVVNKSNGQEMFRFELPDSNDLGSGLRIGYLERIGSEWIFVAKAENVIGGLSKIATEHDIVIAENVRS